MKTVLITGANKSIGFETARQLLKDNYYVYLGCRDINRGLDAIKQLNDEGLTAVEFIEIDISKPETIHAAREIMDGKTQSLDVLINNAGISGGFPQPPSTISIDTMRDVFETNFFGTIQVTNAFMDLLERSASPRIVNVTSGLASLTLHNDPNWKYYPFKGGAYGPSKTALNAYTIALAYELRDTKFKVNAVDPGYTATDFNHHRGTSDVSTAAGHVVRVVTMPNDGPTGQYFSWDNSPETGISPW